MGGITVAIGPIRHRVGVCSDPLMNRHQPWPPIRRVGARRHLSLGFGLRTFLAPASASPEFVSSRVHLRRMRRTESPQGAALSSTPLVSQPRQCLCSSNPAFAVKPFGGLGLRSASLSPCVVLIRLRRDAFCLPRPFGRFGSAHQTPPFRFCSATQPAGKSRGIGLVRFSCFERTFDSGVGISPTLDLLQRRQGPGGLVRGAMPFGDCIAPLGPCPHIRRRRR